MKAYSWKGETGYYCDNCINNKIVQEYNQKNQNDPSSQLICDLCEVKATDYRWPNNGKGICEGCKPRFNIIVATMEKMMRGERVDIDKLPLGAEDKQDLRELQKEYPVFGLYY